MRLKIHLFVIPFLAACSGGGGGSGGTPPAGSLVPEVQVEKVKKTGKTQYVVEDDKCSMDFQVALSGKGTATLKSKCELPDEMRKVYFEKALDKIIADNGNKIPFKIFSVGRVVSDHPFDKYSISRKLAKASGNNVQFNTYSGKTKNSQDLKTFAKGVLETDDMFAEYKQIFDQRGYKIESIEIQNVILGRVGNVEHLKSLTKEGLKSQDLVPYDAMVWFKLAKK